MKHIKTFEDNSKEFIYYTYIDIDKLEYFLKLINQYNINYSLHLLNNNNTVGLFSIFKTTKELKDTINKKHFLYIENNDEVVSNIMKKCEDVTSLSISEIEYKLNMYQDANKYNL